ncbi:hypothetical protein SEA_OBLADI_100 [Gordonia phage ObLaDi]|uniref:Uncharacterized protein n=1 Tax=Gordonia phage ObLaDi TaxID=2978487 RepID=A0A977PQZ1_9CAUD|nr:hypothetical protein SEA_OBLADI_100 [Gordonia phage ObLaDi]
MSEFIDDAHRAAQAAAGIVAQPDPIHTNAPSAHDLVVADIQARKAMGLAKYGTILQFNNGRNHLLDAYEEVLDTAAYLRNQIESGRRIARAEYNDALDRLAEVERDPGHGDYRLRHRLAVHDVERAKHFIQHWGDTP